MVNSMKADFEILEIYKQFELSKVVDFYLYSKEANHTQRLLKCMFVRNEEKAQGFAFTIMNGLECFEFYQVGPKSVDVYAVDYGKDPTRIGVGTVSKSSFIDDYVENVFEFDNFRITVKAKLHCLRLEDFKSYMSSKGDYLGLKWLDVRNFFEQIKWDMINRQTNILVLDENDENIQIWDASEIHSINEGGPSEYFIKIVNDLNKSSRLLKLSVNDENGLEIEKDNYVSLHLALRMVSKEGFDLYIDSSEISRMSDNENIVYFFMKNGIKVIFDIKRNQFIPYALQSYQMFTALRGYI